MPGPPGVAPFEVESGASSERNADNNNDGDRQQQQQEEDEEAEQQDWDDDLADPTGPDTSAVVFRERERRQRTVRVLMMFLLMLLLMDGEEQNASSARNRVPGDGGANGTGPGGLRSRQRSKKGSGGGATTRVLDDDVFRARTRQDGAIRSIVERHPRYEALVSKNGNRDVELEVRNWSYQASEQELDEFAAHAMSTTSTSLSSSSSAAAAASTASSVGEAVRQMQRDPEEDRRVFHYPWNATGFYRGEWTRYRRQRQQRQSTDSKSTSISSSAAVGGEGAGQRRQKLDAVALEGDMLDVLRRHREEVGVYVLPAGKEIAMRDDNNLTSVGWERMTVDASGRTYKPVLRKQGKQQQLAIEGQPNAERHQPLRQDDNNSINNFGDGNNKAPAVTLTHESGRAAFQVFSRNIPSMKELSLVDGFVKLYDSTSPGYSTRKDILLRVRGVMIHAIGRVSLVSNVDAGRSAFVVAKSGGGERAEGDGVEAGDDLHHRRRRLMEALENVDDGSDMNAIREDAFALYSDEASKEKPKLLFQSDDFGVENANEVFPDIVSETRAESEEQDVGLSAELASSRKMAESDNNSRIPPWSDIVMPYPFVKDDKEETIRRVRTPAARRMPPREQLLEANAASCEFEINMDVQPVEWTIGAWRNLLTRRFKEAKKLDPSSHQGDAETDAEEKRATSSRSVSMRSSRNRAKALQDQALVMTMVGTIHSDNCDFDAALNATALRTDWEATTGKAINYSFYMMLVCLTQILVLLRQLLHSQSQSAATRVSLLCVGWQTVIDALLCLVHIYLSLAMQPLFTAFASVAFFKLLIFCVIEMKVSRLDADVAFLLLTNSNDLLLNDSLPPPLQYMAMIIQARNSSNGGQTTEALRRQIAMLHLRFYVALFGTFLAVFYIGEQYRIFYALALYSFWIPQIVRNVVTEAKAPLHNYYIYGMSLSRLVAPIYMFSVPNNFLKSVYPDSPTDTFMCQMIVVWVLVQMAVLLAQGKYGARFMIPARFLPPKFDYSRPLPASMLPPGATEQLAKPQPPGAPSTSDLSLEPLVPDRDRVALASPPRRSDRHTTSVTTRKRGARGLGGSSRGTTAAAVTSDQDGGGGTTAGELPQPPQHCTLDCSICYDGIDIRDRERYMLAPCDHIFHRDCLVQWMDVKMECPICRTELPAL